MIRLFDLLLSLLGLIILSPFFIVISVIILLDDGSPIFYKQERIGLKGRKFKLMKFRTMKNNSDKNGLLTVGARDNRITKIGYYLRKYKLDELPQLLNVLKNDMALVGPRPEVEKYVLLYSDEQRKILNVRPGITDLASLEYFDENDVLAKSSDPEKTYIEEIMPHKIQINMRYIENRSFFSNIGVIVKTILRILN